MPQSEEQSEPLGPCVKCGADCHRLPNGKLWSKDPAPGCLCRVKEEKEMNPELHFKCPGFEIAPGDFSGCKALELGLSDCPICEGKGYIINCPVCGEPVKWDSTCRQGCWFPHEEMK